MGGGLKKCIKARKAPEGKRGDAPEEKKKKLKVTKESGGRGGHLVHFLIYYAPEGKLCCTGPD